MPLRWAILHSRKLVHNGRASLKEMEEHFDAVMIADAMPMRNCSAEHIDKIHILSVSI
jgi:hypothetical protein